MKFPIAIGLAVLATGINSQTLKANLIQKASTVSGLQAGKDNAGQAKSDTSDENFINICDGKTLTNGKQNEAGSCNGIPMGDIPSKSNMVSSIITFPKTGETVKAGETFDITLKVANMVTGFFTNPLETYYAAPQKLQGGKIVGHTHVTVQDMGNTMNPTAPLAADKFAFFKGIDAKADGNGEVKATVTNGLPAGKYRVCTLSSAANHQAVIMPVAQRGTSDDCTKFEVIGGGGGGDFFNRGGNKGGNNGGNNGNDGNKDKDGDDDKNDKNDKNEKNDKDKDDDKDKDKNANAAKFQSKFQSKFQAKANNKRKIGGDNNAGSNDAEDCENNGNNEKPKAADQKPKAADEKPKDADKMPKKSSSSEKEITKKLVEAAEEDCQTLAKRATTRHIENTAKLERKNEIKTDQRNHKRFSRVFVS